MKIKELSEATGLTNYTLRYYEKVGLIQDVKRDENGIREYTNRDIGWIEFLKCMKKTGMPIEDLKLYADSFYAQEPDVTERVKVLEEHKKRLLSEIETLKEAAKIVDHKVEYYKQFQEDQKSKSS